MSLFPNYRTCIASLLVSGATLLVVGCGDGAVIAESPVTTGQMDQQLRQKLQQAGVTGNIEAGRTLPSISDPLAQLGKDLFFTKGLGGNMEVACVTCHHPNLGGGDDLSLSVGVGAVDPDLLGPGRVHAHSGHPNVPRNAPTVFNMAFWDRSVFWDGRIENLEETAQDNGMNARIRTPDVSFGIQDQGAGENLTVAQAHFPVTSAAEMRSDEFASTADNETLRGLLAARIGDYGDGAGELATNTWLERFRYAYNAPDDAADVLITYDNIANAIGEYERSMVFTDNAFNRWIAGDASAMNEQQQRGAVLFYTRVEDDGAGCSSCHSGDFFTDELMHNVAAIQIGEGKGDGNSDDYGRERETGNTADRYKFRTPTLLNVEVTGPYGHAGSFDTLEQVVAHYTNPVESVERWFDRGGVCAVEQFQSMPECATIYPNAQENSALALQQLHVQRQNRDSLFQNADLSLQEQADIVSFLQALTDPCVKDPACMSAWVADHESSGPDGMRLQGVAADGKPLAEK